MMGKIVIDTSAVIAVVANEPAKPAIIRLTEGMELVAPAALHWEIANAFSALFKKRCLSLSKSVEFFNAYRQIPIRFADIDAIAAMRLAYQLDIYAYDAYFLECALREKAPLMTLDGGLLTSAKKIGVSVKEIT